MSPKPKPKGSLILSKKYDIIFLPEEGIPKTPAFPLIGVLTEKGFVQIRTPSMRQFKQITFIEGVNPAAFNRINTFFKTYFNPKAVYDLEEVCYWGIETFEPLRKLALLLNNEEHPSKKQFENQWPPVQAFLNTIYYWDPQQDYGIAKDD